MTPDQFAYNEIMYQAVMHEISVRRAMENSNVVFLDDWRK